MSTNGGAGADSTSGKPIQNPAVDTPAKKPRRIVVCLDGTANAFGNSNTNVINLFSLMEVSDRQLGYYDSGIGTYIKDGEQWRSSAGQSAQKLWDFMTAWAFGDHVQAAYKYLMNRYQDGDVLYIFGFSRGSYTARALAGMIEAIGLLPAGCESQVPLAYEVYSNPEAVLKRQGKPKHGTKAKKASDLAREYRNTFGRSVDVKVHFVGVWDTVASLGTFTPDDLPFASAVGQVKYFRHALAINERRAKFQLEYRHPDVPEAGKTLKRQDEYLDGIKKSKEVWFRGCHSDVGGGNDLNDDEHSLARIPLRWMVREAVLCGLLLDPTNFPTHPAYAMTFADLKDVAFKNEGDAETVKQLQLKRVVVEAARRDTNTGQYGNFKVGEEAQAADRAQNFQESLRGVVYAILEWIPLRKWVYSDDSSASKDPAKPTAFRHLSHARAHHGAPRQIDAMLDQRIHRSVQLKIEDMLEKTSKVKVTEDTFRLWARLPSSSPGWPKGWVAFGAEKDQWDALCED